MEKKTSAMKTGFRYSYFIAFGAVLTLSLTGLKSQDIGVKAADQTGPMALVNAKIYTVSGPVIPLGYITFSQGKITEVGDGKKEFGPETRVVDCRGGHIYPGLISARSNLGLTEIGNVSVTHDYNEFGKVNPEVQAWISVNPDSILLPVTRANGILTAGIFPSGGLVPGHTSLISLDGWTSESMVLMEDMGLSIEWPWIQPNDKESLKRADEEIQELKGLFLAAESYVRLKKVQPGSEVDLRFEGLRSVLSSHDPGREPKPVFILAQTVDQILSAIDFARDLRLRMVLVGGRGVMDCIHIVKDAGIPVMLLGTYLMPRKLDSDVDEMYRLPAMLEDHGIKWCMSSEESAPHQRNLAYHAGSAVAHGLPPDIALRSITLGVAEILGIEDGLGSLEVGKSATCIVTDADVLEVTTQIRRAFIQGREVDLSNHHTRLRDKYIEKYKQMGLWPPSE